MKTFAALIARERWENSAFWIVPGAFAALVLVMHVFGILTMWRFGVSGADIAFGVEEVTAMDPAERRMAVQALLFGLAFPFSIFLLGLMFFYSLGSLYDDRRDRSILFWKSLPVSDVQTVLSKVVAATVLAPALTLLIVMVVHVVTMLMATGIALWAGADGWYYGLDPLVFVVLWAKIAWALIALSLVMLPIIAWLMLASAWARKAPFLWALAPPVAVMIVERWATGRTVLGRWLVERFGEVLPTAFELVGNQNIHIGPTRHGSMGLQAEGGIFVRFDLLWSGQMWFGLAVAAVLLAGAVWLRRYRADAE